MASLLVMSDRAAISRRLERLRPDSARQWGALAPHAAVMHLIDGMRMTFGEVRHDVRDSWLNGWFGRWFVIDCPLPWPKGRITAPAEFFASAIEHDFDWDRNRLGEYVERFSVGPHQTWGASPILGRLTPRQWGKLCWRHLDHHLRQFGC
ncbi:MAG: hypothetical protein J0M02_04745 [Planctomycetes bacterium]|nr:hypothetical protein [Planctomycetota bacterium]